MERDNKEKIVLQAMGNNNGTNSPVVVIMSED